MKINVHVNNALTIVFTEYVCTRGSANGIVCNTARWKLLIKALATELL